MKKGQILEGVVSRYTFPNKGYITVTEERKIPGTEKKDEDGNTVWDTETVEKTFSVKGALKGQKVRFSVKKMRNGGG